MTRFAVTFNYEAAFDLVALDSRRLGPGRWLTALVTFWPIMSILGMAQALVWATALAGAETGVWLSTSPHARKAPMRPAHRAGFIASSIASNLTWITLALFFWTSPAQGSEFFALLIWACLLLNSLSFAFRSRFAFLLFSIPSGTAAILTPLLLPRFAGASQALAVAGVVVVAAYALILAHRNVRAARDLAKVTTELELARAAAEEASAAKSSFLATMSHELRTPMNGVLGMAHALERTSLDPRQADYVRTLLRSGDGLMTILDDVLDLSKIEAGKFEVEVAPFDLHELLYGVRDLWSPKAAHKGLDFVLAIAPELPRWVGGDELRVRQVLLNLVSNALKFTANGRIVIRAAGGGKAGPVTIAVADTGTGIEPSVQSALFKGFSQADATIARRFGGTGLGLSISRQLAELMGGQVNLESQPGKGSTFTLRLPLTPAAAPEDGERAQLDSQGASLPILVVDDNATNLAVARALLEAIGCEVVTAQSGYEALTLFADAAYGLVLMDIQMPGMDGRETLRRLRDLPDGEGEVKVIAVTADAMVGEKARLLACGFDDYLSKPLRPQDLIQLVAAHTLAPPPIRLVG
ncbi:MAG TPA: ATP-binding protein [Caulobacteraceae bacterium]|nr:ATP-binding protein [Caulobacteraceae bacterium]